MNAFVAALENYLIFGAVFAAFAALGATAAREAVRRSWWQPHPGTLAGLYASAVVAPPVLAAWVVTAALLPQWIGAAAFEAEHVSPAHALHLVGDLTAALEPGLAYIVVAITTAGAAAMIGYGILTYRRIAVVLDCAGITGRLPTEGHAAIIRRVAGRQDLRVGLVLAEQPLSFIWGFLRSRVVLSSGLLESLSPAQLAGVLEHEAAHHVRRDNLTKLALVLCTWATPLALVSQVILGWRAEQVELVCDEVAAARTAAPLDIAEALVILRRRAGMGRGATLPAMSSFAPAHASAVESRVRRLVALVDQPPTLAQRRPPLARLLGVGAVLLGILVMVLGFAPLSVHSTAELLIQALR
jgi:Zn-dependent protease with chaperone function